MHAASVLDAIASPFHSYVTMHGRPNSGSWLGVDVFGDETIGMG